VSRRHYFLARPATWAYLLECVCRDARAVELTDTAAVYLDVRHGSAEQLVPYTEGRWECTNNGRRWVSVIESERMVVIAHAVDHTFLDKEFQTFWWEVGFYLTDDAYEDRLDELATVAVVA
jgi:hypothetical protein